MDDKPELLYAAIGRTVIAMDRFSGRSVWRVKLPRLWGGNISMLLPHGNEVYVGRGGYVYCLDRRNGDVLWERGTVVWASGNFVLLSVIGDEGNQQQAAAVRAAVAAAQHSDGGAGAAAAAAAAS